MASNAQQIKDLNAVVRTLSENVDGVNKSISKIAEALGDSVKPAKLLGKELKNLGERLEDTLDEADSMQDKLKNLSTTAKAMSRINWMAGATNTQAAAALEKQIEAAKTLKSKMDESSVSAGKLDKQIVILQGQFNKLKGSVKDVKDMTEEALNPDQVTELKEELEKASNEVKSFSRSISTIDFKRSKVAMEGFGSSMTGIFGGALGTMKIMDSYGFKNLTTTLHKMKVQSAEVKKSMESGEGKAKQEEIRNILSTGTKEERKAALKKAQLESGVDPHSAKGFADSMLNRLMAKRVEGGKGQTLTKMFAQGGGSITEGIGMSSMMGITKFLGPIGMAITAIGGLLAAFGAVGDRRKGTYEALGKGGLLGTGVVPREAYNKLQEQLSARGAGPGGLVPGKDWFESSVMGLNYEKNMATVKALVENGIGVSAIGNKNAFAELKGGRATTMMGGIMRNANYFGHNLGMAPEESVALTVKAIGEFNMSFGETEDLFININRGVTAAGVSTTKYLGIIDNIAGQFSRFNKTMSETVIIITAMGRSGKYTADYIQEMVGSLIGGDKTDEQRAFGYSQMSEEDRRGLARGYREQANEAGRQLTKATGVDLTTLSPRERHAFMDKYHKDEKLGQFVSQYEQAQLAAGTWETAVGKEGNAGALAMAGAAQNLGKTPRSEMAANISLINTLMKNREGGEGGDLMDVLNPEKMQGILADYGFGKKAKEMGVKPETLATTLKDALLQAEGAFEDTKKEAMMKEELKGKKGTPEEIAAAKVKVEEKFAARTPAQKQKDSEEFAAAMRQGNFGKLAGVVTDAQRKEEEQKAEQNFKVILNPLEFIKNTLKAMLDKIIEMLTVVVDWFNKTWFGSKEEEGKEAMAEVEKKGFNVDYGRQILKDAATNPEFKDLDQVDAAHHKQNLEDFKDLVDIREKGGSVTKDEAELIDKLQEKISKGEVYDDYTGEIMQEGRAFRAGIKTSSGTAEEGINKAKTDAEIIRDKEQRDKEADRVAASQAELKKGVVGAGSDALALDFSPEQWANRRAFLGTALKDPWAEAEAMKKAQEIALMADKAVDQAGGITSIEGGKLAKTLAETLNVAYVQNYSYNVGASTAGPTSSSLKQAPGQLAKPTSTEISDELPIFYPC